MVDIVLADGSATVRQCLGALLGEDPRFRIVGEAADAADAIDVVQRQQPAVAILDVYLPGLGGLHAVREIMRLRPTPMVLFAEPSVEGSLATFEALAAGAVDFVARPQGESEAEYARLRAPLLARLEAAARACPHAQRPMQVVGSRMNRRSKIAPRGLHTVIIGVSTGGPKALERLLPTLNPELPLGFVIVQHMSGGITRSLAKQLDEMCALEVREAKDGDRPSKGLVLVAPGDRHLVFELDGRIRLTSAPTPSGLMPSIDLAMCSAAKAFQRRAIGIIMTGMGEDGAKGMAAIKAAGGATLAQDAKSSLIFGMPRAAILTGMVDYVVGLDAVATALCNILSGG